MTGCSLRKTWFSRPVISLLVVAMVMSGCVAGRITPTGTPVKTFQTIAVVPVEAPPISIYAEDRADQDAISKSGLKAKSHSHGGGIPNIYFNPLFLSLILVLGVIIVSTKSSNGGNASVTEQPPTPWMPTIGLGKKAAELLQRQGLRKAFLVEGYARFSSKAIADEGYSEVIRHYYNSDASTIDYGHQGLPQADAIVEVAAYNCSYDYERLYLDVMVKLTDPTTRRVLGRTRRSESAKGGSVAIMLQNEGQALTRLIETTGERLLIQCLQELGLYGP